MGCHHIFPVIGVHILWLCPFAVGLARVDCVFLGLSFDSQRLRHKTQLAAAVHHKLGVAFHAIIIVNQNLLIPIQLPEAVRNQNTCIRPTYASVKRPHVKVHTAVGSDLG